MSLANNQFTPWDYKVSLAIKGRICHTRFGGGREDYFETIPLSFDPDFLSEKFVYTLIIL